MLRALQWHKAHPYGYMPKPCRRIAGRVYTFGAVTGVGAREQRVELREVVNAMLRPRDDAAAFRGIGTVPAHFIAVMPRSSHRACAFHGFDRTVTERDNLRNIGGTDVA